MNQLMNIKGVRGFIDNNGTAHLNLEDVARGLGFIEKKGTKEYVMWRRVDGYLEDFSFGTSAENEFIPENIFYRLAMKAKNDVAEAFQAKVADEILPAIRKKGFYSAPTLTPNEALALSLKQTAELMIKFPQLEQEVSEMKEIVDNEVWLTESQLGQIREAVNTRARQLVVNGYGNAHFQGIYGALKTHFGVAKYNKIPRKDFELALDIIKGWYPKKREAN